jgi:hypothetical protein
MNIDEDYENPEEDTAPDKEAGDDSDAGSDDGTEETASDDSSGDESDEGSDETASNDGSDDQVEEGGAEDIPQPPHVVLQADASEDESLEGVPLGDEPLDDDESDTETQSEKGPLWIKVDLMPEEAKLSTDTLHLYSESGEFDRKQSVGDFTNSSDISVEIVFQDVPMDQQYSLEIIPAEGAPYKVFSNTAYSDLKMENKLEA